MTAYGIHVYDFKGKKFILTFILAVMMIPTQVSAAGFIQLVNQVHLNDTYWPLIIPAIAAPAIFFYMKQYIESSMPLEVIEAARVDGSNEFRTFNLIAIPMLKPAFAVQLIFGFVASWNNFFTPALVIDSSDNWTLPIMMSILRSKINSQNGDLVREVHMQRVGKHVSVRARLSVIAGTEYVHDVDRVVHVAFAALLYRENHLVPDVHCSRLGNLGDDKRVVAQLVRVRCVPIGAE